MPWTAARCSGARATIRCCPRVTWTSSGARPTSLPSIRISAPAGSVVIRTCLSATGADARRVDRVDDIRRELGERDRAHRDRARARARAPPAPRPGARGDRAPRRAGAPRPRRARRRPAARPAASASVRAAASRDADELDGDAQERAPALVDLLAHAAEPLQRLDRHRAGRERRPRLGDRVLDDPPGAASHRLRPSPRRPAARSARPTAITPAPSALAPREIAIDQRARDQHPHRHSILAPCPSPGWTARHLAPMAPTVAHRSRAPSSRAARACSIASASPQRRPPARLIARIAWEFDRPQGAPAPAALSDQAIAKIVTDTFARRPG